MKAFLLAAGLGTRLRPLTDTTPKCMLPIDGTPVIGLWLDALAEAGADEILVNLHHLPKIVHRYVIAHADRSVRICTVYEPELLGSAGTLLANKDWIDGEDFLVCYADGLTDFPLADLISAHRERAPGIDATIAAHRSRNPREAGILKVEDGIMTAFTEKPEHPDSDLAASGIYAFSPAALGQPPRFPPLDIGHHMLPHLVRRAQVIDIPGYFRDIGTPEAYEQAQRDWKDR
jgi:mannose-1-phosphate guanylyltransferase